MKLHFRYWFFVLSAAGLLAFYLWGLHDLPGLGHYPGPYGDVINSLVVYERHATNAVSAVNFDYRGIDTLGEEFILFTSVMGVLLLLRKQKDEATQSPRDSAPNRVPPPMSDAVRVFGLALAGLLIVFGLDIVTHGQLTPGGGFQGGVILASIPLMIYLCSDYQLFCKVTNHTLTEVSEAAGAGGYTLIGFVSLLLGMNYLQNFIPFGQTGNVASGGTIAVISYFTGLEVCAGFVLLMMTFFEEAFVLRKMGEEERHGS